MSETIEAIFQDGVFKPLGQPSLEEGQRVRLLVEEASVQPADEILRLAAECYEGLSDQDITLVERISLQRGLSADPAVSVNRDDRRGRCPAVAPHGAAAGPSRTSPARRAS